MKLLDLERHLRRHDCELFREGGRHSVWWKPASKKTAAVPRHREIKEPVAARIFKDLDVPRP